MLYDLSIKEFMRNEEDSMFQDAYYPTDKMLKQVDAFPIQANALDMFFKRTRYTMAFGLNVLNGRKGF